MAKKNNKQKLLGAGGAGRPPVVKLTVASNAPKKKKKSKRKGRKGVRMVGSGPGSVMKVGSLQFQTKEGLQWGCAYVHPCAENLVQAVGYPDDIKMPTHRTRMQRTVTILPPAELQTGDLWDLMVITSPFPEIPVLFCGQTSGMDMPEFSDWNGTSWQYDYFYNYDAIQKDEYRKNQWYYVNFPNFQDLNQKQTPHDNFSNIRSKYSRFRIVAKGTTTYLNASRLYDQGRVICGQYPATSRYVTQNNVASTGFSLEKLKSALAKLETGEANDDFRIEQVEEDSPEWVVVEPPVRENALFYGSPKASTWEARRGTYQPMTIDHFDMENVQNGSLTFQSGVTEDDIIAATTDQQTFNTTIPGTGNWTVAYYRGISNKAGVTVKTVQYTEGIVNPSGPFANLTPSSTPPDPAVIASTSTYRQCMKDSFRSSDNDFGTVLKDVLGVAKGVGSGVKDIAGVLSGVPVIGELAKGLTGFLGSLGL